MNNNDLQNTYTKLVEVVFEPAYIWTELEDALSDNGLYRGVYREYLLNGNPDSFLFSIQDLAFFYERRNKVLSAALQSVYAVSARRFKCGFVNKVKMLFETKKMKALRFESYKELVACATLLYTIDSLELFTNFDAFEDYCDENEGRRLIDTLHVLADYVDDVKNEFKEKQC